RKRAQSGDVTPAKQAILLALVRYFYLTARQCTRLLYAETSLTRVQALLKELADDGYCQRLFLPRPTPHGRVPAVYTLGRLGRAHLAAIGVDVPIRLRPSEEREHRYLFLDHTLVVNDWLIALEILTRRAPQITIRTMLHERTLRRMPLMVSDADGRQAAVIPDGWLDLRVTMAEGTDRYCIALEIDRGTTEQKAFRRKIAHWVAAADGPYHETFGTDLLTVAIVATPGEGRADELLRWIAAELTSLHRQDAADLFFVTAVDVAAVDPATLYYGPVWRRCDQETPVPLIENTETLLPMP
ncbi:MAG: replication-relaxation family protein, partial [Chloroflexota bacterium]|nr:replication-relaxation family protein [Chloroflexota bacterium]